MQKRHPALAIRSLKGLDLAVFNALAGSGNSSPTQSAISTKLGTEAASQSTISRTMAKLIDLGLVVKDGRKRDANFRLTKEASWFRLPPHARPRVPFDLQRIVGYATSDGHWLPEAISLRMKDAVPKANASLDPATFAREIVERFMIDLSWASSSLEGNTYSLLETEILIKYGEVAAGHAAEEATMILNHKAAIGWIVDNIGIIDLDAQTAFRLHALLMRGLVGPDNLGAVRRHGVGVTNTAYVPSDEYADLQIGIAELCSAAARREDPYEGAFALLIGTAYLQAFADGNKRLGRILSSIPLLKAGLPPISFVGVDRTDYAWGMLSWYELNDPAPIANAIAAAYEISAPTYQVARAVRRVPRTVEIRERNRLSTEIRKYMVSFASGDRTSVSDFANAAFDHLEGEDRQVMVDSFVEVIETIDEIKAIAYQVPDDVYQSYRAARAHGM